MKKILLGCLALLSVAIYGQHSSKQSTTTPVSPLSFSGYVEGYYSYDL